MKRFAIQMVVLVLLSVLLWLGLRQISVSNPGDFTELPFSLLIFTPAVLMIVASVILVLGLIRSKQERWWVGGFYLVVFWYYGSVLLDGFADIVREYEDPAVYIFHALYFGGVTLIAAVSYIFYRIYIHIKRRGTRDS